MASYISVPRDLSKVKTKVFMNLTKRQILCFGAGALIGVPVFFLLKSSGNLSLAALGMMAVMLPLFFLAMYEKDGQPLEVVAKHFYEAKFKRPKTRPYKTKNYYLRKPKSRRRRNLHRKSRKQRARKRKLPRFR